ncbi:MAG: hypothetical protein ACXABU_09415 [Candidatus Hodarchaeales archaeon]|jgi:galactose-1-phosphate uridylyltransferase
MDGHFLVNNKKNSQKSEQKLDGEWGIFSTEKFLPSERYDPFCTYLDENGSKIGHKTIFSPIRRKRPIEFDSTFFHGQTPEKKPSLTQDTFCKLIKGNLPSIVITKDLSLENDPFSMTPTNKRLLSSTAFSTINLYPPISRLVDKNDSSINKMNYPSGLSFVHIFSNHYLFPEDVSPKEWEMFLQNYCFTIRSCKNHPKIAQIKDVKLHTFFNIGPRAGGSISHLHGQSIMFFDDSGSGSKSKAYELASQSQKVCLKCQFWVKDQIDVFSQPVSIKKRKIASNQHWMAFLAYAPEKDAQIRLLPRRHVSSLWLLEKEELTSLAPILVKSNKILSKFIEQEGPKYHLVQDRNIVVRQLVNPKKDHFHMFIDILPVQQLGGAEVLDNQKFSSELPETIASKMNTLIL